MPSGSGAREIGKVYPWLDLHVARLSVDIVPKLESFDVGGQEALRRFEEQEERATVRQEGWIVLARSFSASALLTVSLILSRPIDLYFCSILICTDKF